MFHKCSLVIQAGRNYNRFSPAKTEERKSAVKNSKILPHFIA
ncbi:hypothetical protein PMCN03_0255 [Pasteurella multocida subsp. multocida str. HB03]|nr:hypothetical protein NT08PM_1014 [Pasteurella multocida subsp. multocida str. 3480]AHE63722.1 hypothetical protein PMCN03_0255 [Pasteurella multocida subsp. multocida str. HB03]